MRVTTAFFVAMLVAGCGAINQSVQIEDGSRVEGNVGTVNGRIEIESGSRIMGEVAAVNGAITLTNARIGSLHGGNGDISVLGGSVIDGELRVRETRNEPSEPPRVVIGRNARVGGPLVFEQGVDLHVHESAEIGAIEGAEARFFSGDEPDDR